MLHSVSPLYLNSIFHLNSISYSFISLQKYSSISDYFFSSIFNLTIPTPACKKQEVNTNIFLLHMYLLVCIINPAFILLLFCFCLSFLNARMKLDICCIRKWRRKTYALRERERERIKNYMYVYWNKNSNETVFIVTVSYRFPKRKSFVDITWNARNIFQLIYMVPP